MCKRMIIGDFYTLQRDGPWKFCRSVYVDREIIIEYKYQIVMDCYYELKIYSVKIISWSNKRLTKTYELKKYRCYRKQFEVWEGGEKDGSDV